MTSFCVICESNDHTSSMIEHDGKLICTKCQLGAFETFSPPPYSELMHWSATEEGEKELVNILNETFWFQEDGTAVKRGEWISVEQMLPIINEKNDESSDVLVSCRGKMYVAYLVFYGISGYRTQEEYKWYERSTGCGCCCGGISPTHWMPLPPAPDDSNNIP